MRRIWFALLLLIAWASPASAQFLESKTVGALSGGTCVETGVAGTTTCALFKVPKDAPSITFQTSGTFSLTVTAEGSSSSDSGSTAVWKAIALTDLSDGTTASTVAAAGQFAVANTGLTFVRLRVTTYASGSMVIVATRGAGRPLGGSGGGGGAGDITAVVAGGGLTGGAASGSATVAVGAGSGITVNADDVAIATAGVTLAMMANLAQDQVIGRTTASTGVPETFTVTAAARTVLDDTTVAAMVDTLFGASSSGTGGAARLTSPTFVTPVLGTATATQVTATTLRTAGTTSGNVSVTSVTGTHTIKLPTADGTNGQVIQTDGAGQWSWVSGAGGAPTDYAYWGNGASGSLSAEVNLAALSTGLVLNTAGTPSAYPGATCTNQFIRSLNGSGGATCASVVNADVSASALIALSKLATQAANTVVANVTDSTAVPTAVDYSTLATEMGILASDTVPGASAFAVYDIADARLEWTGASAALAATLTDETGGGGVAMFNSSPTVTTSLVTSSSTFALLNSTATTVNAFAATTTLNFGASATMIFNLGGSTTASELRFLEPSGSGTNYTGFKAVAMAANLGYSLPPAFVAGGALTDVAGDGILTWVVPTGAGDVTSVGDCASGACATIGGLTLTAPKIVSGGFLADGNGNEQIIFTTTASAVNEWTLANGSTGVNPKLTASGETNVGLDFQVKGTGVYRLLATASGPTAVYHFEDTDNGTNRVAVTVPASLTGDRAATLPDADTFIPIIPQIITVTGPTAARTWTVPDAAFSLARIDAAQTFTGVQSLTSPDVTTSITTPSTTFALLNTTATTVNAFGAATTVNTGASATQIWNFGGSTTASEFRYLEPSGSGTNYSAFKAVAQAANITYSLPAAVSGAGGYLRDAAGNGVLDWATTVTFSPIYLYNAGVCQNTTASIGTSLFTSSTPTAACKTGTNTTFGVAQYTATAQQIQGVIMAPHDLTNTTLLLKGAYMGETTSAGNVTWRFSYARVAAGSTLDPSWTDCDFTDAAGTANQLNVFSSSCTITSLAANDLLFWKFTYQTAPTTPGNQDLIVLALLPTRTVALGGGLP